MVYLVMPFSRGNTSANGLCKEREKYFVFSCLPDCCSWNINTCPSISLELNGLRSRRIIDLIHGTDANGGLIIKSWNHSWVSRTICIWWILAGLSLRYRQTCTAPMITQTSFVKHLLNLLLCSSNQVDILTSHCHLGFIPRVPLLVRNSQCRDSVLD